MRKFLALFQQALILFLAFQFILPFPFICHSEGRSPEESDLFEQGKKAYDDFNIEEAISLLEQAVTENSNNNVDRAELTEAYFLLALSYTTKGEIEKAEKAFEDLLKIEPSFNVDSSLHPPKVIEVFERVKKKLLSESPALISINSEPPFSKVFINGEEKGLTPLTLPVLLDKKYLIRIEKDGYQLWTQNIYINQKQTKIRAALEEKMKVVDTVHKDVMDQEVSKIVLMEPQTIAVNNDFEMMKAFFKNEEEPKTNTWLWVGVGLAVLTAGVTYAVLQSQNKSDQSVNMLPRATSLRVRIP